MYGQETGKPQLRDLPKQETALPQEVVDPEVVVLRVRFERGVQPHRKAGVLARGDVVKLDPVEDGAHPVDVEPFDARRILRGHAAGLARHFGVRPVPRRAACQNVAKLSATVRIQAVAVQRSTFVAIRCSAEPRRAEVCRGEGVDLGEALLDVAEHRLQRGQRVALVKAVPGAKIS